MSNKKQSSIDWLINELKDSGNLNIDGLYWSNQIEVENAIKQAKAMHMKEIISAHVHGEVYQGHDYSGAEYYNKTFES